MSENDPREQAADPPSDHETPGGNPVSQPEPQEAVRTEVETPGGTTVTEEPSSNDGDDSDS